VRPEDLAAAHVVRRARGALARVARALLLVRLLAAAADVRARLRGVRAGAPGRLLGLDELPEQVVLHLRAEDGVGEVDRADLLAFYVDDVDLHGGLPTS
jgi:hypothetical protein